MKLISQKFRHLHNYLFNAQVARELRHVVGCGSNSEYQKYTRLKDIGLHAQNMPFILYSNATYLKRSI